MNQHLLLASTSARRKEILAMLGLPFKTISPEFDEESIKPTGDPQKYVQEIAEGKGRSIVRYCDDDVVLLATDTTVWLDDKPIGKPQSQEQAKEILRILQGRSHSVWTGIWVRNNKTKQEKTQTVHTRVEMNAMTNKEITWYITNENVLDKAGAYGIQGKGSCFIGRIEGDFYNVVGLPVAATVSLLKSVGLPIFDLN